MRMRSRGFLCLVTFLSATIPAVAQSGLSANSGINSADTWVVADLTVTASGSINLPNAFYNPATGVTSNVLPVAPPTRTLHIEAGYDSSGGLIMNVWPTGTPVDPTTSDANVIGFIRFAGGQITVFDQNGTPLPLVVPSGVSTTWPLNLLGSNPASSVIKSLVVPNIQNYATAIKASLTMGTNPTAAYVKPPVKTGSSANWTYAPSGSVWVAQQLVLSPAMSNGSVSRTIQFANMNWYDNASNDAARAAKGYTAVSPPSPTTSTPSGLTSQTPSSNPTYVKQLGGSQNVSFVHGFASNSGTWNRMTGWLNQDFRFGAEVVPTLSSLDKLSNQGTALINDLNSAGGANYILIGHSQGGLISRYAAQQLQSVVPTPVRGVVALDSPHHGAPLAILGANAIQGGFQALGNELWQTTGCITPYDNFVCYMAALAYQGGATVANDWLLSNLSVGDLVPGSPFLNQLNAATENFQRAGIVSNTPMRWNEMRILDNAFFGFAGCNNPDAGCGERAIAAYTGYTYDVVEALFFFSIFEEIFDSDEPNDWAAEADFFLNILIAMDAVDGFWNVIVSGFSSSDAIVPSSSQNYPSITATQYPIHGADSHTGAVRSSYVRSTLDQVLLQQFQVPTQASCSFSDSPATYPASGNGGSSSFNLTTGAGCQWSAISEAPWVSITSGSSGTSSGTVSFAVAANPSTLPRVGTIQVGNNSSVVNFTVDQAGMCTYPLNPPFVAFAPGGGTATINVGTQSNCAWSAVSNTSWLTITSGASGTGPGSFTIAAAPGTTTQSFSGTITVMDQTLDVVVGSSVGTSGTGKVTIMGQPYCVDYNPTTGQCMVYGSGFVRVAVDGDAVGTGNYGAPPSAPSATAIAASLASNINAIPNNVVSATASGAVVTLTAKLKGSATNYSLSTSYFTNYPNYFYAVPSGNWLTGGTD